MLFVCFVICFLLGFQVLNPVFAEEGSGGEDKIFFNIPRQRADLAIVEFAEQADVTFMFPYDKVSKIIVNPIKGTYTKEEALEIMLDKTGLESEFKSSNILNIFSQNQITEKGGGMEMGAKGFFTTLIASIGIQSGTALAQGAALEEIVVTAQRREQSLQEVPISIEAISGGDLQQQGYRNLDDLARFSPSVYIDDSESIAQERSIRGFGTSGFAATLEQAVPMFVDGIHYGRASQVKNAFLDIERVEILKGPQPVFFGMNATAGAFSIESRMPTDDWNGYADAEYGNNSSTQVEGAFGGPITETLGFRIAGKYESSDGFIEDVITGEKHNDYRQAGGRLILQWTPTEDLEATFKLDASRIDKEVEAAHICLTDGSLVYPRRGEGIAIGDAPPGTYGTHTSVWADPPQGSGWNVPHTPLGDCFESNLGIGGGGPFFDAPENIRFNETFGAIDNREARDYYIREILGSDLGLNGGEVINSDTAYFDLQYQLKNGIEINSKTAYNRYFREYVRENRRSPFNTNNQYRSEKFDQWSTELRFTSPTGGHDLGDVNIDWMFGFTWQITDYDVINTAGPAGVYRGTRHNDVWEDQEWRTGFATITFNFFENRASIDLGARYTDLVKDGHIEGVGGQWVFDITPCNDPNDDPPTTCTLHPDAVMLDPDDTLFLLDGADTSNLWALAYGESRSAPLTWHAGPKSIGLTNLDPSVRNGPYTENFNTEQFDPQITLRYRVGENHSIFARWAQSFKAGGFDTGTNAINPTVEEFRFDPEYSESFELGSKGKYWDGRARYDITFFETIFRGFQVASTTGNPDDPFVNINAGKQRVRGIEFSTTAAVSDQLVLSIGAAILDGKFTNFPNAGCTEDELAKAPESGCDLDTGLIDRTGTEPPQTPDWKFVAGFDYWFPVGTSHKMTLNGKGYISDGFLTDVNGYSKIIKYNKHEDLNLIAGYGDRGDIWRVSLYARNIFGARPSYNPEFDVRPDGFEFKTLSQSSFFSYGLKFRYNYR